ncbi:MAG: LacI family transcriptional regulator [Frondihabitans sp.]|nr:LacI family transcriptional regulator [Frondihabitans sp.]
MDNAGGRPTIRTVAARAQVSKSLVSLVLQGSDQVSPARRAAVEKAIAELDYRPSLVARTLTSRRTGVFGIVMNDLRNPWFVDCLEGFAAAVGESGYRTILADESLASSGGLISSMLELHVDGLVLMGTMQPSEQLRAAVRSRPTVVAASRDFRREHVDVVANDDASGTRIAVEHLLALGHERIAHIAGATGAVPEIRRREFGRIMRAHGHDEPLIAVGDMTERGGSEAAMRLLEGPNRPTAIFAVNDMTAIGVLSAARTLGLDVPGDLSVVGYDNTDLAAMGLANLTSVDNASHEVGALAAAALLSRMGNPGGAATERLVPPRLVVRNSTARPPLARQP